MSPAQLSSKAEELRETWEHHLDADDTIAMGCSCPGRRYPNWHLARVRKARGHYISEADELSFQKCSNPWNLRRPL